VGSRRASRAAICVGVVLAVVGGGGLAWQPPVSTPRAKTPPALPNQVVLDRAVAGPIIAEAASGDDGGFVATRRPEEAVVHVRAVDARARWHSLPLVPVGEPRTLVALTVWAGSPCVAAGRPVANAVSCFLGGSWQTHPLPTAYVGWKILELRAQGSSLFAVLEGPGHEQPLRVARLRTASGWLMLPPVLGATSGALMFLGDRRLPEGGTQLLAAVVGSGRRTVVGFRSSTGGWQRLAGPTRFRGLQNQWSGPIGFADRVLLSRSVIGSGVWPFYVDEAPIGGQLRPTTSKPISVSGSQAQGRMFSARRGAPWIIWQEASGPGHEQERRRLVAARLDRRGVPGRRQNLGSFPSAWPSQLGFLQLGSADFALATRTTRGPAPTTQVVLLRLG
jgi:hypothetical protein